MIDLGIMKIAAQRRPIVDIKDIYRHVYCVGKHRSGKTNFFVNCFDQLKDHAFIILDPSGELAYQIAGLADKDRLIWVDKENPLTINPIKRGGLSRGDMTKDLIEIIDNCTTSTSQAVEITPMMEEIIRNAIRVFKEEDLQLDFLCDFLSNEKTREKYGGDKYWADFDEKDKSRYGYKKWQHRDSAQRISTRITALFDYDDFEHFTIGENQFDVGDIAKNKRIVIFNLQGFNPDAMLYMGNLIMCAIKGYFTRLREPNQYPMFVMADEFYQFITPAYKTMLTGSSKHSIGMFLCHHSHDQAKRDILDMAIGLSHIKVVLSVGSKEAERMSGEFQCKAADFLNLKPYHAQILIGNKPHLVRTFPPLEIPQYTPPSKFAEEIPTITNYLRNRWFQVV